MLPVERASAVVLLYQGTTQTDKVLHTPISELHRRGIDARSGGVKHNTGPIIHLFEPAIKHAKQVIDETGLPVLSVGHSAGGALALMVQWALATDPNYSAYAAGAVGVAFPFQNSDRALGLPYPYSIIAPLILPILGNPRYNPLSNELMIPDIARLIEHATKQAPFPITAVLSEHDQIVNHELAVSPHVPTQVIRRELRVPHEDLLAHHAVIDHIARRARGEGIAA
ncbi:MAG: hypothetical protein KGJ07_03360 [Patescibacteria group bacterium]|nr:hypothetical protein [Patescibacteria group bacterium]MDE2588795.1 hypothetical protein [Patescibacteria group bacterium]